MPELLEEIKGEIETINTAWHEQKKTHDQMQAEIKKLGKASAETEQKWQKAEADLARAIDVKDRLEQLEVAMKRRGGSGSDDEHNEHLGEYKAAFDAFMRKGHDDGLGEMGQKALRVNYDPDGGYFVAPDTSGRIVERIFETSPLRRYASVQTIGTDALEGIYDDDEAGARWTGETQPPSNRKTPEIGKWRIPTHEMETIPKATQKLLEDSSVNIEQWLLGKVARKFARAESTAFVGGDGVNSPRGFLTYPDASTPGEYERGAIERVGSGGSGAVTFDGLIDLFYSLKADYQSRAVFAANRVTWGGIRKLQDLQGQYLWQPPLQAGEPASLLGVATAVFNDMPAVGAGELSVAIADWEEAYQIVDRLGIAVLRDPYSSKPFVEFYTRRRVGGDVLNFDAIKLLEVDS